MSSLFYLPVAGLLASSTAWVIIEPSFLDFSLVGGEVLLVNHEPFEFGEGAVDESVGDAINWTVKDKKVIVFPTMTLSEPGADGQPPFGDLAEVQPGTVVEVVGEAVSETDLVATAVRPATPAHAETTGVHVDPGGWTGVMLFPLTAVLVALAMLVAEGISSRNWIRMVDRVMVGSLLTLVFSFLSFIPAAIFLFIGQLVIEATSTDWTTVADMPAVTFVLFAACRSGAWAAIGAGLGLGMNLARATKAQLRNSVIGGALGGALGGVFFDPIDRFFKESSVFAGAELSRVVGLVAVGLSVGFFVALVDQLAREAWLRVRTGPLAGKSFVLYKTPTSLGSSPRNDVYLFKDAQIDPEHAVIHRVGNRYEIEDRGSRVGTKLGGQTVRRERLSSGDQIVLGATVLEFEERAKQSDPAAAAV
jgi:hypothetical protein